MNIRNHLHTLAISLRRWFVAQSCDALAVGSLWLLGLSVLQVPLAPLWAILAFLLQFIPGMGTILALPGPATAAALSGGTERLAYVLLLYAAIVILDGLALQPLLMKRTSMVPVWASILVPLAFGLVLGFWGVLLAPPLLIIFYTFRGRVRQ